ncbi:Limit dextrin alpha-1,6-maltotetraose-hydrolase [hydrothermal vent metagenome]|uniref:Limit dextrin alpha-1,6-maltotetraose-hydrolase n=1 Tax=hydrothermal vent metagenome TaxID=652676 RepID=A0A3B0YGP5_9ZZZZ
MSAHQNYKHTAGVRYPTGVRTGAGGVNFSVFSRHATRVELLLFAHTEDTLPFQIVALDPAINKTFFTWHVHIEQLPVGTWYAWRMDGPGETRETGRRFDPDKALLDPWARAVCDTLWERRQAIQSGDNSAASMRCMVVDEQYDWEDDTPLALPFEQAIIYELHVGGFTRHASAGVQHPGTFSALIEKIPYLKQLGITHVELMPIMAFDEQDIPGGTAALGLKNYWGYSTHSFFSPHPGYCVTSQQGTHQREFRDLVKALHHAGIGVILDVVFNHTAEGGAQGPVINFKGFGSSIFYHLDKNDKRIFRDYTGCGNTVNCNHPVVASFIINCLEYWVREMHVDGFRFDLASALARGEDGTPLHDAPVLWGIELSEQLAGTKLIAEAWDAAGLYQVGSFPGYRWAEWNGRYRDIMRRFVRGDKGIISEVATRLSGSADFYQPQQRLPINSINFITCHDGFTLYDQFSYREKHNLANGENNRDGHNDNLSDNCGIEGDTSDEQILALRKQLARNSITTLLLSQGVPMLLSGDEVLRTQQGNNNGYCQDNDLTWFAWELTERNADMLFFVQQMIALRRRHPCLMRRRFLTGEPTNERGLPDISWCGPEGQPPGWGNSEAQVLGFTLAAVNTEEADLHIMLNMSWKNISTHPPIIAGRRWHLAVDTAATATDHIFTPEQQHTVEDIRINVSPRSIVVLEAH